MRKGSSKPGKSPLFLVIVIASVACGATITTSALQASGDERILSYHSHISVHDDSSMTVRETIKVRSTGKEIKHGIYRYFPTRHSDEEGHSRHVDLAIREVLRNGKPEAHHLKELFNGKRLYIGNSNVLLEPGEYTYTVTYDMGGQIDSRGDHDVLRWPVTGMGWAFPIDSASATVELPRPIPRSEITLDCFTGAGESDAGNCAASLTESGNPAFLTTRPLKPREGLMVMVTWPKGFVVKATPAAKTKREDGP